ncbi:MAG: AbrB family transcriptional regulator [Kiloniellales bacterium]
MARDELPAETPVEPPAEAADTLTEIPPPPRSRKRRPAKIPEILLALAIGTAGGWIAWQFRMPLAWMIGAMVATLVAALAGLPVRTRAGLRTLMVTILGVMLGSSFTPEIVGVLGDFAISIAVLALLAVVSGGIAYSFLRRVAGYDRVTAYFSSMPGGLTEMAIVGSQMGGDLRVISLSHSSRILLVVLTIPFAFKLLYGYQPGAAAARGPSLLETAPLDLLVLTACAVLGYLGGRLLKLPASMLLGPMVASAAVHLAGWSEARAPFELVNAAQVVIGCAIGTRFAGTALSLIWRTVLAGFGVTVILVGSALLFAEVAHLLTGVPTPSLVLAYAPGGVAEMSLIAVALGSDVALVASHHIVRILMIVMAAPLLFRALERRQLRRRGGGPGLGGGPT